MLHNCIISISVKSLSRSVYLEFEYCVKQTLFYVENSFVVTLWSSGLVEWVSGASVSQSVK